MLHPDPYNKELTTLHKTPSEHCVDYQHQNTQADDIDLRELVRGLWAQKILIIVCTVVVTCIAAAYAFFATPIYETTAQTLPPTASDLASYNVASQLTGEAVGGITQSGLNRSPAGIGTLSAATAYKTFLKYLGSDRIRQDFFAQFYLPAHTTSGDQKQIQKYYAKLSKELTITIPSKPNDFAAKVLLEGPDPEIIATWANTYINLAMEASRQELLDDLTAEVRIREKGVKEQIDTLRQVARTTHDDRITRLRNALVVAESIGLETPPSGMPLISVGGFAAVEENALSNGNMLYLRGYKALRSELEQLEKRSNNDAYIVELPNLLKTQSLLESIDLAPAKLAAATIDRAAAVPEDPIKPKRLLILALGVILGSMLGVFWALMRDVFK